MTTTQELLMTVLVGKKLKHRNYWGRDEILEVESVKMDSVTRDLEPSTQANDWWPASETRQFIKVIFVNGSYKEFDINNKWDIIE